MDTQAIIEEALTSLELRFRFEREENCFVLGFTAEGMGRYLVFVAPTASGVELLSPFLAGETRAFDPVIAAHAAVLAFGLGLELGVDPSDGEVRARAAIDLLPVEPELRAATLRRATDRFLAQQARAREAFADFRERLARRPDGAATASRSPLPDLAALRRLPPSA